MACIQFVLLDPVADGLFRRLKLRDDLYAVSLVDGSVATAVGEDGTILRTENGGDSWVAQAGGTTDHLLGLFTVDAHRGTAVGSGGTILHTSDAGAVWEKQESGTTASLNGVYFTSTHVGTAVGNGGLILHTEDGGATWHLQTSGTTRDLQAVTFTSTTEGMVVGGEYHRNGIILKTTDGGATWKRLLETSFTLKDVAFADAENGMVVGWGDRTQGVSSSGYGGMVLRTLDGGTTWASLSVDKRLAYQAVDLFGPNIATVVSMEGEIVRTTTGGLLTPIDQDPEPPQTLALGQNYPNPFNPTTKITFDLPHPADVSLEVVDVMGRQVSALVSGSATAGRHDVFFDATGLPAGVYFYRLRTPDAVRTRSMLLVK